MLTETQEEQSILRNQKTHGEMEEDQKQPLFQVTNWNLWGRRKGFSGIWSAKTQTSPSPVLRNLLDEQHKGTTSDPVLRRGEERVGATTARETRQWRAGASHLQHRASLQVLAAVTHRKESIKWQWKINRRRKNSKGGAWYSGYKTRRVGTSGHGPLWVSAPSTLTVPKALSSRDFPESHPSTGPEEFRFILLKSSSNASPSLWSLPDFPNKCSHSLIGAPIGLLLNMLITTLLTFCMYCPSNYTKALGCVLFILISHCQCLEHSRQSMDKWIPPAGLSKVPKATAVCTKRHDQLTESTWRLTRS